MLLNSNLYFCILDTIIYGFIEITFAKFSYLNVFQCEDQTPRHAFLCPTPAPNPCNIDKNMSFGLNLDYIDAYRCKNLLADYGRMVY